jgi:hypothetical protein
MLVSRLSRALQGAILSSIAVTSWAADSLVAKQLAGPVEEFATMAAIDPAAHAIYSKSALIPIAASKQGMWQASIPVDGDSPSALLIGAQNWSLAVGDADLSRGASPLRGEASDLALDGASVSGMRYDLGAISAGNYQFQVSANAGEKGFLLLEGASDTQLMSYVAERTQTTGESVTVIARLSGGKLQRASLELTDPKGERTSAPMFDDGLHQDGSAGDGVFAAQFNAEQSGIYVASTLAFGTDDKSQEIVRSAEHVIPIVADSIDVAAGASIAQSKDGRLSIRVPVQVENSAQHYRGYAQVWGRDARGADLAIAWVGGMVQANDGAVEFGLDSRWIEKAGASGPFTLRELRLEDPDHFVSLETISQLDLNGEIKLSSSRKASNIVVDDLMRMGPMPEAINAERGVGTRLLLVHGYCSGAVWPAANFSNASTFLDANQNRSHDQFARLISTFGNTWNSYGIVAHSQGGAAALHLYNYYWSGLDRATGARLIQSVGTPYKGTNLAGVLAALGGIFGVGCGTNTDLTYSGAASWLAGISTASRGKVNYYTTSFKQTGFFTNDYCNFASDLVLSDPEDGTTEVANGQLSGGVNRGSVTGQCHTDGMRDPAQYRDAGRNGVMSSNAAR